MEISSIDSDQGYNHLILKGRLDANGAQEIEEAFMQKLTHMTAPAMVDISDVSYVSSFGIRLFITAAKKLRADGFKLALFNPQPLIVQALTLAKLDSLFIMGNDESTVVAQLLDNS